MVWRLPVNGPVDGYPVDAARPGLFVPGQQATVDIPSTSTGKPKSPSWTPGSPGARA